MSEEYSKKKELQSRIEKFTWFSKQELYDYFEGMYNLERKDIDSEIDEALKTFKLRKGQPIDTKELWQKVGSAIEQRLSRRNEATQVFRPDKLKDFNKDSNS